MWKIIFFLLSLCVPALLAQSVEKTVIVPPVKSGGDRYFYIPFDVPANTKSLSVSYSYNKKDGQNVLDLGVFDSGFDEFKKSLSGFRGWSGGRRDSVFIAEKSASHGYLPGKISSGKWQIILGLYKVVPEGVEVTIKVKINEIDTQAEAQLLKENKISYTGPKFQKMSPPPNFGGFKWYRGDLHMHTFYSDGNWTYPMIFDWASAVGLDFLGLTEHNTAAHHDEINLLAPKYKNLLILRGEEVTTYGGHFNVWGLPTGEIIDFRITPKDGAKLHQSLEKVHNLGLLASINHPTAICGGCDWSYGDWLKLDSVEIWNGSWDFQDENALKLWDQLLQNNQRSVAIGSSDTHRPPVQISEYATNLPIGFPTNHAGMKNLSQPALLSAVKAGRIWISDEPKNYELEFSAGNGGNKAGPHSNIGDELKPPNKYVNLQIRLKNFPTGAFIKMISNGEVVWKDTLDDHEYKLTRDFKIEKDSYFRIEVRNPDNKMLALTNPIFVKVRK